MTDQTRGIVETLLISIDNPVKSVIVALSRSKILVSRSAEVHSKGVVYTVQSSPSGFLHSQVPQIIFLTQQTAIARGK